MSDWGTGRMPVGDIFAQILEQRAVRKLLLSPDLAGGAGRPIAAHMERLCAAPVEPGEGRLVLQLR